MTGGTFYRSYDGVTASPNPIYDYTSKAYPATVSDFRLDRYEITVGRFRKFLAAYSQSMIVAGSGKNPHNPRDPGWDTVWNASLPMDAEALKVALKCGSPYQTWTDLPAGNENRPMNCLSWYEAFAFCIWDGGRPPTEAEWNYAAAGGSDQRMYPWGNAAPDCMYANFSGAGDRNDYCVLPGTGATNNVGSESPKGDGKYGQADLAGNAWEWTLDSFSFNPPMECFDCANTSEATYRVFRGGSFDSGWDSLLSSSRSGGAFSTSEHYGSVGARCARSP